MIETDPTLQDDFGRPPELALATPGAMRAAAPVTFLIKLGESLGWVDVKVVVTGGGNELGEAIARRMSRMSCEGASVAVLDRDPRGKTIADFLAAVAGGAAVFHQVDVTDEAEVSAAFDALVDECGSITTLVNNAGCGSPVDTVGSRRRCNKGAGAARLGEAGAQGVVSASDGMTLTMAMSGHRVPTSQTPHPRARLR
ncbi:SDR family NAD(P)-dependent oxidoreductase [Pseudonocardia phyllosphaerae]|uniref:SDR family NAD(P)-dependent oxidoreductase n=1 Tax=Pseudonocardia phyllosphaerae TaxID=3390502 RepID=UPI00397E6631